MGIVASFGGCLVSMLLSSSSSSSSLSSLSSSLSRSVFQGHHKDIPRTIVSRTCVLNASVLGKIVLFSRKDSIYFQFPIHESMFHLNLFSKQNQNKIFKYS